MTTIYLDPVRARLESGVHPEWNARNISADYFYDGRIWVRCTFKDNGTLSASRPRHSDVPLARIIENETDLHAWASALYYHLENVKAVERSRGA
jgi:hypothetical protein